MIRIGFRVPGSKRAVLSGWHERGTWDDDFGGVLQRSAIGMELYILG